MKKGFCKIGNEGAKQIAELLKSDKDLTDLDLGDSYFFLTIRDFLIQKKQNKTEGNDNKDANCIFEVLKTNQTLLSLNMVDNYFDSRAFKSLLDVIKNNSTLTNLVLGIPSFRFFSICEFLFEKMIFLGYNAMNNDATIRVFEALKHNTGLRNFNMGFHFFQKLFFI